ncbi:hypothetical protein MY04_3565 [Flammeovirga sp. MY04]|uniref:hypothetical protein n=1 Tax=Flammeovirga sp. MY04 TaxID=1191459 RepID=UPI000806211D|nr:hypothetical protein [Flammeovirga sp. MY04]ANQ50913.1 hypothetical protein MY04_3565 [Flammeovirga sp. MY04]
MSIKKLILVSLLFVSPLMVFSQQPEFKSIKTFTEGNITTLVKNASISISKRLFETDTIRFNSNMDTIFFSSTYFNNIFVTNHPNTRKEKFQIIPSKKAFYVVELDSIIIDSLTLKENSKKKLEFFPQCEADSINFLMKEQIITLSENAKIKFELFMVKGNKIQYNFYTKDISIYISKDILTIITNPEIISIQGKIKSKIDKNGYLILKQDCIYNSETNILRPLK